MLNLFALCNAKYEKAPASHQRPEAMSPKLQLPKSKNTMSDQKVRVITQTTNGVRVNIYGKDMSYNASTEEFFLAVEGRWKKVTPTDFQKKILLEKHQAYLSWKVTHDKQMEFLDKNPNYVPLRDRPFNGS
mgnify:CR=1 FL=1